MYIEFYEEIYLITPLLITTFIKLKGPNVLGVVNYILIDIELPNAISRPFVKDNLKAVWFTETTLNDVVFPATVNKLKGLEILRTPAGN